MDQSGTESNDNKNGTSHYPNYKIRRKMLFDISFTSVMLSIQTNIVFVIFQFKFVSFTLQSS